jgi:hypothetical protein
MMSGKKYTGPLPKSKPTGIERFTGSRSTNKPTTAEEQERIADRMAKKFKKSPKAQQYNKGGLAKTTEMSPKILETIREIEKSGKTFKPKKIQPERPISDKDIESLKKLMKPANFFDGGEVRGMGKAYQGGKRSCKVR